MKPGISWSFQDIELHMHKQFKHDDLIHDQGVHVFVRGNGYFMHPARWLTADEILRLYLANTLDIAMMDGSFIIAIRDEQKNQLQIITDHLNFFPLYEKESEGQITLSDSLLHFPDEELDEQAIRELFTISTILGNKTLFGSIQKIPAASICTYTGNGSRKLDTYWQCAPQPTSEAEFKQLFSETIGRIPKLAQKPSLTLTAGLDSRMVFSELLKQEISVDTFTYGHKTAVDVSTASKIAHDFDIPHRGYLTSIKNSPFMQAFPKLLEEITHYSDGMIPHVRGVAAQYCFDNESNTCDMVVTATGELVYSHYAEVPTLLPKDDSSPEAIAKFLIVFNADPGRPDSMRDLKPVIQELTHLFEKQPMDRSIWYYDLFYLTKLTGLTSYYQQALSQNVRIFNPIFTKDMINHSMGLYQQLRDHRALQRRLIAENIPSLANYLVNGFKVVLPTPRNWSRAKTNYAWRLAKKALNKLCGRTIFPVSYINYTEIITVTERMENLPSIDALPNLPVADQKSSESYLTNYISLCKWLTRYEEHSKKYA